MLGVKFNRGFYPREGRYAVSYLMVELVMRKHKKVKNRVGAGWILQITVSIFNQIDLTWKTVVEVARDLADECTITEAEFAGGK